MRVVHSVTPFLTAGGAMPKYTAASPDEPAPAQAGADQWRTCVLCALGLMLLVAASGLSWFADATELASAASAAGDVRPLVVDDVLGTANVNAPESVSPCGVTWSGAGAQACSVWVRPALCALWIVVGASALGVGWRLCAPDERPRPKPPMVERRPRAT